MRKKRYLTLFVVFTAVICLNVYGDGLSWPFSNSTDNPSAALLLSDIHFDPFADGAAKELDKTPVSGWRAVLESKKHGNIPGYGDDANYRLLCSAVKNAGAVSANAACAIICGDLLCHGFEEKYRITFGRQEGCAAFAVKTIEFVALIIKEAVPGKSVFYIIGNNDSDNGDYNILPEGEMLGSLAGYFDIIRGNARAHADFSKGGYYELPFPGLKKCSIIALNDIFWHKKYKRTKSVKYDPGDVELKWLKSELDDASGKGEKAVIVMHIPPGIDTYLASKDKICAGDDGFLSPEYNRKFFDIMKEHSGVVSGILSGHSHFDDFRVFSADGTPFLTVVIVPSVSPGHGNNPAFEAVLFKKDGSVKDKAVYYLPGSTGGDIKSEEKWKLEYTFCGAYGLDDCGPYSLNRLTLSMEKNGSALDRYFSLYTAGNPVVSSFIKQKSLIYRCALTAPDFEEYSACACVKN